jgi:PilZ domain-containing protein
MKRRYLQRASVRGSVIFTVAGLTGEGQILDLTVPGCMVESDLSPQKGDSVTLRMFIPQFGATFNVSMGVVRWVKGDRFGVEFIAMKQKDRLRYNLCVAKCLQGKTSTPKTYSNQPGTINWHLKEYSLSESHK